MNHKETEGHKIWLFNLTHGNLTDEKILKGFIKYYALNGYTVDDVADDMLFKMNYNPAEARERLIEALEKAAGESS